MSIKSILFFFLSIATLGWSSPKIDADISFFIADLKYSHETGVKICEVQQLIFSEFKGYDFSFGTKGFVEYSVADFLANFKKRVYFTEDVQIRPYIAKRVIKNGGIRKTNVKSLIQNKKFILNASKPLHDPTNISDYNCFLFSSPKKIGDVEAFRKKFPSVLLLDRSSYPYWTDKLLMTRLFQNNPILEAIKPEWGEYAKVYTPDLAAKIVNDLNADTFVIKPRGTWLGNGVIIVAKEDLDKVLHQIIVDKRELKSHKDTSYSYWATDPFDNFIVEKFYPSDPVQAPLRNNKFFDGTIRIAFTAMYNKGKITLDFSKSYWKLPKKALHEEGSLTIKHKSLGKIPNFLPTSPEVSARVHEQMQEAMTLLYQRMLENYEPGNYSPTLSLSSSPKKAGSFKPDI